MKRMILTVAMLLSAAGIRAAAAPDYAIKLQSKNGERLGLFSAVSGVYWKNNAASNPDEIWSIGGKVISKNKAFEAELQRCELKNHKNNFVSPETEFIFPKNVPVQAYGFQCLADFAKKHPGELNYKQLHGEFKGREVPFSEEIFKLEVWPKF